jgi:hypothetical protein
MTTRWTNLALVASAAAPIFAGAAWLSRRVLSLPADSPPRYFERVVLSCFAGTTACLIGAHVLGGGFDLPGSRGPIQTIGPSAVAPAIFELRGLVVLLTLASCVLCPLLLYALVRLMNARDHRSRAACWICASWFFAVLLLVLNPEFVPSV